MGKGNKKKSQNKVKAQPVVTGKKKSKKKGKK
jgi:hypothetical protein